jgi:hypothetical protein
MGLAVHLLSARGSAFMGKVLWMFERGQNFLLTVYKSLSCLDFKESAQEWCPAALKHEEILGYLLQLTFCDIMYYTPNFILEDL